MRGDKSADECVYVAKSSRDEGEFRRQKEGLYQKGDSDLIKRGKPVWYLRAQKKVAIPPPEGVTKVSPITIFNNSRRGKSIRARRVGDELASQALERGNRPIRQADRPSKWRML